MHLPPDDPSNMSDDPDQQLRSMVCDCGIITQPDGSCHLTQGDTSVMAAVYGPTEVRMNRERLDRAHVDLIYKPKTGLPGCAEKAQEKIVKNSCETAIMTMLHPRTAINIILQEMQNSGSLLACCINSSCLALLDAAVPLKFMIAAVSCIINSEGKIILDPTAKEEQEDHSVTMTFVFESRDSKVLSCNTVGPCSNEQLQQCLLTCRTAAEEIFKFYRETIEKKLSRKP